MASQQQQILSKALRNDSKIDVFNLRDEPCDQGIQNSLRASGLLIAPFRTKAQHFLLQQQEFVEVFISLHYRVQRTMLSTSPRCSAARVANVAPVEGQPYRWGRGRSDASIRQSCRNIFQPLRHAHIFAIA